MFPKESLAERGSRGRGGDGRRGAAALRADRVTGRDKADSAGSQRRTPQSTENTRLTAASHDGSRDDPCRQKTRARAKYSGTCPHGPCKGENVPPERHKPAPGGRKRAHARNRRTPARAGRGSRTTPGASWETGAHRHLRSDREDARRRLRREDLEARPRRRGRYFGADTAAAAMDTRRSAPESARPTAPRRARAHAASRTNPGARRRRAGGFDWYDGARPPDERKAVAHTRGSAHDHGAPMPVKRTASEYASGNARDDSRRRDRRRPVPRRDRVPARARRRRCRLQAPGRDEPGRRHEAGRPRPRAVGVDWLCGRTGEAVFGDADGRASELRRPGWSARWLKRMHADADGYVARAGPPGAARVPPTIWQRPRHLCAAAAVRSACANPRPRAVAAARRAGGTDLERLARLHPDRLQAGSEPLRGRRRRRQRPLPPAPGRCRSASPGGRTRAAAARTRRRPRWRGGTVMAEAEAIQRLR